MFYSKSGKRNYLPNKLKQYQVPTLLRECVMENDDLKDLYPVLTEVTYIYCVIYIFCNVLHVSHTCIYIYIQKEVKLLCIKGHTVSIIVCTLKVYSATVQKWLYIHSWCFYSHCPMIFPLPKRSYMLTQWIWFQTPA